MSALRLQFLPANVAWAVTFGDSLVRLTDKSGDFPLFFQSKTEAVAALVSCGLRAHRVTGLVEVQS